MIIHLDNSDHGNLNNDMNFHKHLNNNLNHYDLDRLNNYNNHLNSRNHNESP